jgi:enamine deaminase RidA (YjgF/YER057c/UK114 family)
MKSAVYLVFAILLLPAVGAGSASGPQPNGDAQTTTRKNGKKAQVRYAKPDTNQRVRMVNPETLAKPLGRYSQVVEVTSADGKTKTVYVAGQVAVDKAGNLVGKDDFRAQVEQIFKNIKAAVEAAGGDMTSLVKTNYYVAETVEDKQYPALREVRDQYIDVENPPASTFVVVKRLVRTEYLLEVEAVAVVEKQ